MKKLLFLVLTTYSISAFAQNQSAVESLYKASNNKPFYEAYIGNQSDNNRKQISKDRLRIQLGIGCQRLDVGYSPCRVEYYDILLISDETIIYSEKVKSCLFTDESKTILED